MTWLDRISPQLHLAGGLRQSWPWRDPRRCLHDHELLCFGPNFHGRISWDGGHVDLGGEDWAIIPPGLAHVCEGGGPGAPWRLWVHFDWDYSDGRDVALPLMTYAPVALRRERLRPAPAWVPLNGVTSGRLDGFTAVRDLHRRLCAAWSGGAQHHRAAARGLLLELLARVLAPDPGTGGDERRELALRIREVLDRMADQPFANADALRTSLARLGRSADHCAKVFRSVFGLPPARYLAARRMAQAEELLASGRRPADVARDLGFDDAGYFNRLFRRQTGVAPGRWQGRGRQRPD